MDEGLHGPKQEMLPELRRTMPPPPTEVRRGPRIVTGLILLVAVLLGTYLGFRWMNPTEPARTVGRNAPTGPQPVGAATVSQSDIRVIVNALGTVTPVATVTVQTQVTGQLQEVVFAEGQMVKKGDLLAQVDPRPFQLLEAQYEGQLAHDQGVLAQARTDLTRYQKLAEEKSIARQQYEDQVYVVQQDEGTVKIDQAQIDQQKLNITYSRIVAPISGRIGLRLVDPGNYVQANNTTGLAVITQLQPITVVFAIPEDELSEVQSQLATGMPLTVYVYDRANVHLLATGRVAAIDSQIDTTTGTVKLRAQFDNSGNAMFPNQFVNAQLVVKTLHDAVTVPVAAIQRGAPGTFVYIITPNDTVAVRPIHIGPTDGPMTAVSSGLSAGERVVVDGIDRLRDGMRVTVPDEPPSTKSPSVEDAAPPSGSHVGGPRPLGRRG